MELTNRKPGRRLGSKNVVNRPLNEKAEIVFNEVFKTFGDDLSKASRAERLNAAVQLAGHLLTSKETNQKPL